MSTKEDPLSDVAFGDRFEPSEERADVWPEYWEMFKSNPILGVGLGDRDIADSGETQDAHATMFGH